MIYTIVVTFNGERWIRKCLNSLKQSTVETKIIIVDNGSTDQTVAIVSRDYPEAVVVDTGVNLGFGRANNLGIAMAMESEPDYIFLLNQDAWVESDTLLKLVDASERNERAFIMSPIHLNGRGSGLDYNFAYHLKKAKVKMPEINPASQSTDTLSVDFVNAAVWLIKSKHLAEIGEFDPIFFHYGEDNDFANRAKYHGLKILIEPTAIAYHDRPQSFKYDSLPVEKKFIKRRVPYLIILMDINQTLSECIRRSAGLFAGEVLKHLKKLNLVNVCVEVSSYTSVFFSFFKRIKVRRKTNAMIY